MDPFAGDGTASEEKKERFSVNPAAETILNTIASIILVLGWLVGITLAIAGVYVAIEMDSEIYFLGIPLGGVIVFAAYVAWARLRLLVNMSRSLYNINDALRGR